MASIGERGKETPCYPLIPAPPRHSAVLPLPSPPRQSRALVQSAKIAAPAVVVEAIDAGAAKFYEHFGFVAFPSITPNVSSHEDGRQPV